MKISRVLGNCISCNGLDICIGIETGCYDGFDDNYLSFGIYRNAVLVKTIDTNLEDALDYCNKNGEVV